MNVILDELLVVLFCQKSRCVYLKYIKDITCVLRGIMKSQHVDPEEAVQIHMDIQAKASLAVHWGTFALAYEV